MSDFSRPYIYGFGAGLLIGGGGVAVLAVVLYIFVRTDQFVKSHPRAEAAIIGAGVATIAFSLILAVLDGGEEGDHAE